ncbi:MAG: FtsX-like permease family protein [Gammaproteobacteria bacterium]|nr:ABC transporter permease [Rhodocyclaceae bacterium]MBU3910106.1 FtsX-like permease family protein [Gammaproteobacteria bacterium]MBU3990175.1 FtsX-like permease family protein [Gammaproteobacteria bacterium]MBU4006114.1 FtsX-like permease family protein [Gammaproteobacteria bacterium]MBU4022568.1 FtsX-like permease family protein [Gammaproteobacteria bacterium]
MFGLLKLALRNIFRHRGRTAMTLASIIFGVVALILAGGFIEDTIVETGEAMIRSNSGHVQVAKQGYWVYGSQNPEKYLIEQPEDVRRQMQAAPGVDDVMFRIAFSGLLGNGRSDWSIIGEGVEPAREAKLASYITVVAGRQLADTDQFGMMIGAGVAKALKLKPGDPVTLLVSTTGGAANLLEFELVGVFQTFSKDYDARIVRISLGAAQELLATPGAHTGVLLLQRTSDSGAAAEFLREKLGGYGFEIKSWVDLNEFYQQTVTLYEQQFGFLVIIILAMLLLSVSNTVNIGIFERVSEFGTMMAMGDRSARVFRLIVTESLCLGIIGSFIGVLLGIVLAQAISVVGIPMPPPPNADQGYISHILVVPEVVGLAFGIGVCAALLASLLPARKVSRMHVAEALRQGV